MLRLTVAPVDARRSRVVPVRPFIAVAALAVVVAVSGWGGRAQSAQPSPSAETQRPDQQALGTAEVDRTRIRDVIHRFNEASLAGDSDAVCALVDPAKLSYLDQIGQPCEQALGGTLTADSERDVRSRAITSIEIKGNDAVAHTRGVNGPRDLALHRTAGRWLIVGV